jgi:glucan phosphoethanolaminetransferase (alkaline phosphatase superfamily)
VGSLGFFALFVGSVILVPLAALPIRQPVLLVGAVLNVAFVAAISNFVFSEDRYLENGSSKWSNRGSREHTTYLIAVAIAAIFTALFAVLAARNSKSPLARPALVLNGCGNLVFGVLVLFAFDNN